MHKPKPWKCPSCGAEVPDLPMRVLEHQLSHVERLPYVVDRRKEERPVPPAPAATPDRG